jgi:hypothetical protein
MLGIALKMLFGDPVKLSGLVLGIAFATLLMAQQGGFFIGLISRAANAVTEAAGVDVWVMDLRTETAEGPTPMRSVELFRVRGVAGVEAAAPLVRATATLRTSEGRSNAAAFLGIDDASLLGINPRFVVGRPEDRRRPDAIAIDQLGFSRLWPGEPLRKRTGTKRAPSFRPAPSSWAARCPSASCPEGATPCAPPKAASEKPRRGLPERAPRLRSSILTRTVRPFSSSGGPSSRRAHRWRWPKPSVPASSFTRLRTARCWRSTCGPASSPTPAPPLRP